MKKRPAGPQKKRVPPPAVEIKQPVIQAEPVSVPETAQPAFPEHRLAFLLPVLALLAFGAGVSNDFVFFDDDKAVLYNAALRSNSLLGYFTGQNLGMYAPFTWLFYGLGKMISEKQAWGHHLIGLLLHTLNTVLLYAVLQNLFRRIWPALFAAALFAVHPVQTEAVSWVAAMSTVLFTSFYLASWLAYQKYNRSSTLPFYILSLVLFAAAALSKSAAVTLPLLLMVQDWFEGKKLNGKFWMSKIPFLLIALFFGYYTFITREQEGHDISNASAAFDLADRFWMVSQTLLFYPFKLLVPVGFTVAYPFVKQDGMWPWYYYAAPSILAAAAIFVYLKYKNNKEVLFALALYLLPLTVMLPFRTVGSFELRSDRYVYLSAAGIFLLLALATEKLRKEVRLGLAAVLIAVCAFLAYRQTRVWENGVALFENCVAHTPESSLCQCNLGYNKLISLDFAGAVKHYTEALNYDSSVVEAYNGRGQAYFQLRQIQPALNDFDNAIKAGIETPKLYLNRGKCLVMLNRPAEAIPSLEHSIKLEPREPETYFFQGFSFEKTGRVQEAMDAYKKAIDLKPDYIEARVNRGLLAINLGKLEEAVAEYSYVVQRQPQLAMAWNNRANAYLRLKEPAKALADAEQALKADARYVRAHATRAAALSAMGRNAEAAEAMKKAQTEQTQ